MKNLGLRLFSILLLFFMSSCDKSDNNVETDNTPNDKPITAIVSHKNAMWVGTSNNGLYKLEENGWTHFTLSDGLLSNTITSIVVDKNDDVWVSSDKGISRLKNGKWINLTTENGLFSNDIYSMACDPVGNIWIGTRNNNILKYDGDKFVCYHVNPTVSGPAEQGHIHTISCDLSGNIWVGSCKSGLSKFDGQNWTDCINNFNVFVQLSMYTAKGDLWVAYLSEVYRLSSNVWVKYTTADGLVNNDATCFASDQQNNIWIGTLGGLSKYDGTSWTNYTTNNGLKNNNVTAIACDHNNNMWIGSPDGLIKLTVK